MIALLWHLQAWPRRPVACFAVAVQMTYSINLMNCIVHKNAWCERC